MMRQGRIHAAVAGLYLALAIAFTWPLVLHLSSHVPGSYTWAFDEYTFLWNPWWFRYSLLNLGQNPLYSTYTFYPLGISLVPYTYNLFNALISIPMQPYLSLPAISNLIFLLATVGSAYGAFLLVRYLLPAGGRSAGVGTVAAFLAGLIYAFGSYRMVYAAIGHYDMWSTTWIPFYALYLVRTVRRPGWRNAVLAAVFVVLAMLGEMIFGVFLAMLTLILLAFLLGRKARQQIAGGWPALARRLLVLVLVAVVLYAPLLVPILREMFGGYELAGWGDAERLSVDLAGLVTPTALHPLGGNWADTLRQVSEGTARFRDVNTVFLGWAGLALAVVGAVRYRRRLAAWIAALVVFVTFGLGPLLQLNGRSTFDFDGLAVNVPLPFILLHYIPIVKANRVPNRFSVVLMLALAVLAAFGAYWLLRQLGRLRGPAGSVALTAVGLLLAAALLFEHWSAPLPLTEASIPPVYETIAAEPGDFAILQLPLGWRNSFGVQGAESTQTQYYQTYHHKRLLSGNISRNPPFKFDYFARQPILESLIALQTYEPVDAGRRAADRATAAQFVTFYDVRYVVVAPGVPGRPPYVDTRDEAIAYIEEVLPVDKVYDEDGWLLYRVERQPLPADLEIDVGSTAPQTQMALGEGWGEAEEIQGAAARWAVSEQAAAFLPAAGGTGYRLSVEAMPFDYSGAEEQGLTPWVNGRKLERVVLAPGWNHYQWDVPAPALPTGLAEVRLAFDRVAAPADVLPGSSTIGGTGVEAPLAIEVNSGGPAGFAYITLGDGAEAQDGSLHGAGYNLAVVDPTTGRLLDRQAFDTTSSGSEAQSAALAAFVGAIPEGQIVVVALQGQGAAHLTAEAVAALHALGGRFDPLGDDPSGQAYSHAIVGVKGAMPGTALEAAGPDNGWLRVAPDRRTLAAAVQTLVWERNE